MWAQVPNDEYTNRVKPELLSENWANALTAKRQYHLQVLTLLYPAIYTIYTYSDFWHIHHTDSYMVHNKLCYLNYSRPLHNGKYNVKSCRLVTSINSSHGNYLYMYCSRRIWLQFGFLEIFSADDRCNNFLNLLGTVSSIIRVAGSKYPRS